ncbi:fumarylacetoacetate (FAA) hydrolase, partial [mine drainage metagenome]
SIHGLINDFRSLDKLKDILSSRIGSVQDPRVPVGEVKFAPPITAPPKIWCIGLNYREHAEDLKAVLPLEEPASFMRPRTTIIGHKDSIKLPPGIGTVTAEAEMGIIIGREAKNVELGDARKIIFGITPAFNMTALDILQKNPRFLTRAKSFDTFFSFGPVVATVDDVKEFDTIKVSTIKNGKVVHSNIVKNMIFSPEFLVSFHSRVFTSEKCDIVSPGSPGAMKVEPGDVVKCRIEGVGLPDLENSVVTG